MKKLNFNEISTGVKGILTREQMKNVFGGASPDVAAPACTGTCSGIISTPGGTKNQNGSCTGSLCLCNLTGNGGSTTSDTCAVKQ